VLAVSLLGAKRRSWHSVAPLAHDPETNTQNDTDDDRGGDGNVDRPPFSFDADIARQVTQTQSLSKKPDKASGDEDQTESNQNFRHVSDVTTWSSVEPARRIAR